MKQISIVVALLALALGGWVFIRSQAPDPTPDAVPTGAVVEDDLQPHLLDHLATFERRVAVETWNEEPVLQSDGRSLLESAGFYRSYPAMVWERPLSSQ